MRFGTLSAALLCGAALLAPLGAEAAEGFSTQLFLRTALGPQEIATDTPLDAGAKVRLVVTASEDTTVSVRWQPVGGEMQPLASDVRLAKGETLAVPGNSDWIELGAGDGREAFVVFATDRQGNVEEEQVGYLILDKEVASLDQAAFASLRGSKAGPGGAVTGFANFTVPRFTGFASPAAWAPSFAGDPRTAFAVQLAKVPAEPATFTSTGASLFKKVADGVVLVLTNDGIGSGSLITPDGHIITNWHVVEDFKQVGVVFRPPPGTALTEDMILLADVEKISVGQDLALLKLRDVPAGKAVLALGDLATVDIGNEVHAVGHPKGQSWTYTRGYVSQIRDGYTWQYSDGSEHKAQVIQTQTPINPGNSGGPLFDDQGTIIGVNSFGNMEAQGLNFAVSIAEVKSFLATPAAAVAAPAKPPMPEPPPAPGAPAPPPAPGAVEPPPPPPVASNEPQYQPIDENGNGKPEAYGADRNGDGYFDIVVVDENEDGNPEYAIFDNNYNGVVDMKVVATQDADGPFDLWMVDADEDGKPEQFGFDWDQDGIVDEWRQA